MRVRVVTHLAVVLASAAACAAPRSTSDGLPTPHASPSSGWTRIAGGPGTICAPGTPYAFFVHEGDPRQLMIMFQGGGACWDAATCAIPEKGRASYKAMVGEREVPGSPMGLPPSGLLDLANPANPTRGWTVLYVPYCTGDVHLGGRTVTYTLRGTNGDSARSFRIHHNGAANAAAALGWIFARVAEPRVVLVAGESAGSVPTPVYALRVAKHYPEARVVQLGDASGAYREAGLVFGVWGATSSLREFPEYATIDPRAVSATDLYTLAAQAARRIVFAQINAANDSIQLQQARVLSRNEAVQVPQLLALNFGTIRAAVPGFRSYTFPGQAHTVLWLPRFYRTTVDGVRLRDWVADLLSGKPVQDVGDSLLPAVGPR